MHNPTSKTAHFKKPNTTTTATSARAPVEGAFFYAGDGSGAVII
jgi:hypothetical protein